MNKKKLCCMIAALLVSVLISGCRSSDDEQLKSPAREVQQAAVLPEIKAEENSISEEKKELIDISLCTVTVKDKIYQDKFTEPYVRVEYSGKVLTKDRDYILLFGDKEDKKSGHYKFTLEMTGDYKGTKEFEYNVRPIGTAISGFDNKVTSVAINWHDRNYICDGYEIGYSNFDDTSYEQIITLDKADITSYTMEGLAENSSLSVRIRTYKDIVVNGKAEKLYSPWSIPCEVKTKTIENINGVTYIDGILIANKTYALPPDYGDGMDDTTMDAYYKMYYDAAEEGIYLNIVSGFRSYWLQDTVYHSFVYERGVEQADRVSARPGHSEHQTGLAMDINSTWFTFADTPEGIWLKNNCARYGFIIRYPEGKEDITGYAYESWHIRYVGEELAQKLTDEGLTLEEYLGITSCYS